MDDFDTIMEAADEMDSDELKDLLQDALDLLDEKALKKLAKNC